MGYNTNQDILLNNIKQNFQESLGQCGGQLITAANTAVTGKFTAICAVADCTVTTVGNLQVTSLAIPAGMVLYGYFTSVTVTTANEAIVYNLCS
jgi:hypothetical protein